MMSGGQNGEPDQQRSVGEADPWPVDAETGECTVHGTFCDSVFADTCSDRTLYDDNTCHCACHRVGGADHG